MGPSLWRRIANVAADLHQERGFALPLKVSATGQNGYVFRATFESAGREAVIEEEGGPETPLLPVDVAFEDASGRTALWRVIYANGKVEFTEVI